MTLLGRQLLQIWALRQGTSLARCNFTSPVFNPHFISCLLHRNLKPVSISKQPDKGSEAYYKRASSAFDLWSSTGQRNQFLIVQLHHGGACLLDHFVGHAQALAILLTRSAFVFLPLLRIPVLLLGLQVPALLPLFALVNDFLLGVDQDIESMRMLLGARLQGTITNRSRTATSGTWRASLRHITLFQG